MTPNLLNVILLSAVGSVILQNVVAPNFTFVESQNDGTALKHFSDESKPLPCSHPLLRRLLRKLKIKNF
jgi:hypothetical protein